MKKQPIIVLLTLLSIVCSIHAQDNENNVYSSNPRPLSSKPATIKGKSADVVFASIPLLQTYHTLGNNSSIDFKGQKYFSNNGNYFIYNGGRYLLVKPPIAMVVKNLPKYKEQIGDETFYCNGIFYKKVESNYKVIKQPQGAVIYNLPSMTDVVTIGNEAYYEYLGVLYKKVFVKGEQAFEVVGELTQ